MADGGWRMADDKMRMTKCGWKNADDKKIKIINQLINELIRDFPHFFHVSSDPKKKKELSSKKTYFIIAPFYFSTKHHHYSTFFPIFINN